MFVDTDAMIRGLKQDSGGVRLLDGLDEIWLSSILYMELLQNARSKKELQTIVKGLESLYARTVQVDESISRKAIELIQQFAKSHGLYLADALIAATAVQHGQGWTPVTISSIPRFLNLEPMFSDRASKQDSGRKAAKAVFCSGTSNISPPTGKFYEF